MRFVTILSVLLLVFSLRWTGAWAQSVDSVVEYPDGNVSAVLTLPGTPFESTAFLLWHLEVDPPAPLDHDIFVHQIGTFGEFIAAFYLDFIDIHEDGRFHFDVYVSADGVNFDFVDETLVGGP